MRILITHNNFPAQFRHVAEYLGRSPGNQVVFATKNPRPEWEIPGVRKAIFSEVGETTRETHPFATSLDTAVRHGASLARLCHELRKQGFVPDVVLGHSGWGQTLFVKDVFPDTPFVGYFEWYYDARSEEITFDGRERSVTEKALLRMRNSAILHDLVACDVGISPTQWQRSRFPREFRDKIVRVHDGINTRYFSPADHSPLPPSALTLDGVDLTKATELVTYCSRGMEPYRGFPQFYRALPAILEARPGCHVLIVGEDRICYSQPRKDGRTYREALTSEVELDESRVHFTGPLPYGKYRQVLRASNAHVYLTWPFVLSWSLLEAMSCGCLCVASDTSPVREVIAHERNGLLTDFRDSEKIAASVVDALERGPDTGPLRENARRTVLNRFCLTKCLPIHLNLLDRVVRNNIQLPTPEPATTATRTAQ
ncbi:glycosyltransferase [Pseudodesulfovibrio tunisiensis]|uniref:glycosyltransferase n=1 Tax=Pseudodesulfovibrio tunisiensis TaxID=463192 RepID=UPI001FB2306B|nr:glycosyltransferase [Pseudodesulfovibrio tunisiensis]